MDVKNKCPKIFYKNYSRNTSAEKLKEKMLIIVKFSVILKMIREIFFGDLLKAG